MFVLLGSFLIHSTYKLGHFCEELCFIITTHRVTVDRFVHSAVLGMWCIKHTI